MFKANLTKVTGTMFNVFAQNLTKYTLSASAKRTKLILKETNVKWESRSAGRKVKKRAA